MPRLTLSSSRNVNEPRFGARPFWIGFVLLPLVLGMSFAGCDSKPTPTAEISQEITKLQAQTASPTSSQQGTTQLRTKGMSVTGDWLVWTSSPQQQYFGWVAQQLSGEYRVSSQQVNSLTLTRTLPGDIYILQLTCTPNAQGNDIRVRFEAMPD